MNIGPFVYSVLHPSDFSTSSRAAFVHAMAIVLYYQCSLSVLHVVPPDEAVDVWTDAPSVRGTLERWGLLEPGSPREATFKQLSLWVEKVNIRSEDRHQTIRGELERLRADLMVLANEGGTGLPGWIKRSLSQELARRTDTMTLFVPSDGTGFVSEDTGEIRLRRILVPVDERPDPGVAVRAAARAAVMSVVEPVEISLLRVGSRDDWPEVDLPRLQSCTWNAVTRQGNVAEEIVSAADALSADLIVMTTEGVRGLLGALRGSVTEQVVRQASRPVLAVPSP